MSSPIRLNIKLIHHICDVLEKSVPVLIDESGINRNTWYSIVKDPERITVQQLLAISNSQKVPVRRFFSEGKTDVIERRVDYIADDFVPCSYDRNAMQNVFDSRPDVTWTQAANAVNMSRDSFRQSLLGITRTPVVRFLKVCTDFDIDPFSILIDNNKKPKDSAQPVTKTLQSEIDRLKKQVDALSADFARLEKEHATLIEEHKRILQQLYRHDTFDLAAEEPITN